MLSGKAPFKIIVPGRTYRCDSDQTHAPMFHQLEGLHIDKDITMGHLKGCLDYFVKEFFEVKKIRMRFRPSHFPFTEPSAEVDIGYRLENGRIIVGEGDKWLEILGCGMVHPNVLKNAKVDPKKFQGYAFGMGIDRLAMLKYGINDLRSFFEADFRWLNYFGFDPLDVPTNYRGTEQMIITLSWLKDHLITNANLEKIIDKLTDIGLEVEGIKESQGELSDFKIAKVLKAEKHPNADKLKLCEVSLGNSKIIKVVCGAANARDGLITVYAPPGTVIPKTKMKLKVAKIRGVESHGMLCSESELNISDESDGIIELRIKTRILEKIILRAKVKNQLIYQLHQTDQIV